MNRQQIILAISTGVSAAAILAFRILVRKEEARHNERLVAIERETQNIRDFREGTLDPLITELDRKIEAGKFWLIVTQPD